MARQTRMNQRSGRAGLRSAAKSKDGAVPPLYMRRMCVHDGYAWHRYRLHQCEDRGCRHSRGPRFVRGHPERARISSTPPRVATRSFPTPTRPRSSPRRTGASKAARPKRPSELLAQVVAALPEGQHHRRAGHRHRRPPGRPDPRHPLRERVQGHRPRHRRAAPGRHHRLRDGRRDVQVHQAGDRPGFRPGGHRRLRHQRRLRRGHRLVHGPAGQPPALRHRGRGRHRPGRRQGRVHRRALLGLRQVGHDPRPAEGLSASRSAQGPVQRGGAQLSRHHHQGQGDRRAGGLHRRRGGQHGRGRGAARGVRDRRRPPHHPRLLRLDGRHRQRPHGRRRGDRRGDGRPRSGQAVPGPGAPTSRPATSCPWTGSSCCATG